METLNAKAALHLKEQELEALKEKKGLERESLQTEIRRSQHNAEISNLAWQTQFAKHVESLCAQCTGSIGALLDEKAHRLQHLVQLLEKIRVHQNQKANAGSVHSSPSEELTQDLFFQEAQSKGRRRANLGEIKEEEEWEEEDEDYGDSEAESAQGPSTDTRPCDDIPAHKLTFHNVGPFDDRADLGDEADALARSWSQDMELMYEREWNDSNRPEEACGNVKCCVSGQLHDWTHDEDRQDWQLQLVSPTAAFSMDSPDSVFYPSQSSSGLSQVEQYVPRQNSGNTNARSAETSIIGSVEFSGGPEEPACSAARTSSAPQCPAFHRPHASIRNSLLL